LVTLLGSCVAYGVLVAVLALWPTF